MPLAWIQRKIGRDFQPATTRQPERKTTLGHNSRTINQGQDKKPGGGIHDATKGKPGDKKDGDNSGTSGDTGDKPKDGDKKDPDKKDGGNSGDNK